MKKILPLLLALLLVLSACAKTPEPAPADDPPSPAVTEPDQPEAPNDTPEPSTEPEQPAGPQPETLDLESVAIKNAPGFYDLSALPQLSGLRIASMQLEDEDHLILIAGEDANEVYRFSLKTGELILICTLPAETGSEWAGASFSSVDPLVIYLYQNEHYYYIDGEGNYYVLPQFEGEEEIAYWNGVYTEDTCFWYQYNGGSVWVQPLDGGAGTQLARLPQELFYYSFQGISIDSGDLIFTATGPKDANVMLTLSTETGEVTGMYEAPIGAYDYVDTDRLTKPVVISSDLSMEEATVFCLSASSDEQTVSAEFDLSLLGTVTPNYESDFGLGGWVSPLGVPSFWGKALLSSWIGEHEFYLLWNFRNLTPETVEPLTLTPYSLPDPATPESLAKRAEALEETYGISIHMGQDIDAPYPDYTLTPCEDMDKMDDMLDVLEEAMAIYPEDYFQQLGGSGVRGFSFYFSGEMIPNDPSVSISNPAGLTCLVDGVELIAFDIRGSITVQDVVHELTHVLDHWLWEDGVLDEEIWSSMNPEDFSYYYAYIDPDGNSYEYSGSSDYTSWSDTYYSGDMDSIYFVDPYSTTYPTEDRARLMEYLLADMDSDPNDYFSSIHIQQKLLYYFQCIREKFDTTNWPDQTSWEERLDRMNRAVG